MVDNGRQWSVALYPPLDNTVNGVDFTGGGVFVFGVTLNGAASPGLERWVALPLRSGVSETDFTAE